MANSFRVSEWRISEDGLRFETGSPTTGMVSIGFDKVAEILVTDETTLASFVEELSLASAKKSGAMDTIVRLLVAYMQVKGESSPSAKSPQPFGPGDGY